MYIIFLFNVFTAPPPPPPQPWPQGPFTLPMAADESADSDCPSGFIKGSIVSSGSVNSFSDTISEYLSGDFRSWTHIQINYCTSVNSSSSAWPAGQYCIGMKSKCPPGFNWGEIFWDDRDYNSITISGTVPDGIYEKDTNRIRYCCRKDGSRNVPISLPTSKSFILYPYGSSDCQKVQDMMEKSIWIKFIYNNEKNMNRCSGQHPFNESCGPNHVMNFCYYQK